MSEAQRQLWADRAWLVEVYHRAVKQFTGIERGQFRLERAQRNHIGLALRAYVRLGIPSLAALACPFSIAKLDIIRSSGTGSTWLIPSIPFPQLRNF